MSESKYVLHYGGQTFDMDAGDVLDELVGRTQTGVLTVKQSNGRTVTLVTGPGIPIALEEREPTRA